MDQPQNNTPNNKNKKIFIISFLVFLTMVIIVTIDMARRTTAPWNKKKEVMRAFDGVIEDSTLLKPQIDTVKVKK
jgi:hypothetical protein